MGSIQEGSWFLKIDPEYIDFLAKQETLFEVDQEQVAEMMKESGLTAVQDKSTPLLDFIREKGRKKLEKIKSRKILSKLKDPAVNDEIGTIPKKKKNSRNRKKQSQTPSASQSSSAPEGSNMAAKQSASSQQPQAKKIGPKFLLVKRDGTTHAIGGSI